MSETKEKQEIVLSFDQVKKLAEEIMSYGENGKEKFLLDKKAIKLGEGGAWIIMSYEGLKNAGIDTGYGYKYETDIPYTFWNKALEQVDYYLFKRGEKYKEQQKALEPKNI